VAADHPGMPGDVRVTAPRTGALGPHRGHVRLAVAASHQAVRHALVQLIAAEQGFTVVAVVEDDHGAARSVLQHHPSVLVLALAGVLREGGAVVRRLRALAPETAVILVSSAATPQLRAAATEAGAAALVALDEAADRGHSLVEAIHAAAARS
jgi:DNA-binding NarL/FixJ family response regulator